MADLESDIDDCWNRIGVWGAQTPRCPELDRVVHCVNCKVFSAAGRKVLDRASSEEYLRDLTEVIAGKEKRKYESDIRSVVIFRLGEEWLGLPTQVFQEVLKLRKLHSVPYRRGNILRGLINVRGELQLCVSLGRLLGVVRGETPGDNVVNGVYERMVVIAREDARYVFPVSEVRGVVRYAVDELLSVPATAMHSGANYFRGMLHWKDKNQERHVGCLDEELLFAALERGIA
ncbi:MAG: chemotaxis protein CheW [Pseudomonadota bacterium]